MNIFSHTGRVLVFTLLSVCVMGQSDNIRYRFQRQDTSSYRLTFGYTSDYYYMGSADALKSPYLTSSLGYFHSSGFFVRGGAFFLSVPDEARLDLLTLSAGYRASGQVLDVGGSITGYFFHEDSYAVPSELNGLLKAFAGYDLSWMMVYLDAGIGWGSKPDGFAGIEINHTFYALKDKFRVTPVAYLNFGTQQYYDAYYSYRNSQTGLGKGGHGQGQNQEPVARVLEARRFELLDYEAEMQMTYTWKRIRLNANLVWTVPVHPAQYVDEQGVTHTEELRNGFYWSTGIRLIL